MEHSPSRSERLSTFNFSAHVRIFSREQGKWGSLGFRCSCMFRTAKEKGFLHTFDSSVKLDPPPPNCRSLIEPERAPSKPQDFHRKCLTRIFFTDLRRGTFHASRGAPQTLDRSMFICLSLVPIPCIPTILVFSLSMHQLFHLPLPPPKSCVLT